MEPRLGELRSVRVHVGREAAASAEALGAAAYTWRDHIVFGPGRYQPESSRGLGLLAHELVHVAQQRGASEEGFAVADGGLERNARDTAWGREPVRTAGEAMIQRQGKEDQQDVNLSSTQRVPERLAPVTLFPLPADLQAMRDQLLPGVVAPALPRLRLGETPSPQLVLDTARPVLEPRVDRPEFRQLVIDSFLRAQGLAGPGAGREAPLVGSLEMRDELSTPGAGPGASADKAPDVTHQTLVGYDPQNTLVLPRSQHVRGSGVGVVVDQAAVQFDGSVYQHRWHGKGGPSGDVTLSLLTAPTVQAQTEGFPQPAAGNNSNVPSNVQQASIAGGGTLASVQVGPDENPRFTANVGSLTAGVQAGSVAPQAGGAAVPQPTQFQFGAGASVEATVHTFCDGSRLGIGFSTGVQAGVTPGQGSTLTVSPTGITFTYHQGGGSRDRCK